MMPDLFVDLARGLERACFDYVIIEDSSMVPYTFRGSHDTYLRYAASTPKLDPAVFDSQQFSTTHWEKEAGAVHRSGLHHPGSAFPPLPWRASEYPVASRLNCYRALADSHGSVADVI